MKTSNTNLDQIRERVAQMMADGADVDTIVKALSEQPQAEIVQADGERYTLLVAPDKKSYQMRDVSGKVLDEKPLENHVMLLLQQLAVSQFSELLLTTKIEEFDDKVTELEELKQKAKEFDEVSVALDGSKVESEQEGRKLDLWTRVIFFANTFAKEVENKIRGNLHMPTPQGGGSIVQHAAKADVRLMDSAKDVDRLTSPIEIIIGGYVHTGKTLLSVLMEKAFRDAGFNNIKLMNPEEPPGVRADILQRLAEDGPTKTDAPEFFNKEIRISEAQSPRASKPMLVKLLHTRVD